MARKNLKWGNIQFEWNKSHAKIITDKGFGPELNKAFAKLIAKYSYDYVPYSFPENNNYEGQKLHLADKYYIRDYGTYATIVYTKKDNKYKMHYYILRSLMYINQEINSLHNRT